MEEQQIVKPLLALRGLVVLPHALTSVDVGRDFSVAAVREAYDGDKQLLLATQQGDNADFTHIDGKELSSVAVLGIVKKCLRLPNNAVRILVDCRQRVQLENYTFAEGEYLVGTGTMVPDVVEDAQLARVLSKKLIKAFENWAARTKKVSEDILHRIVDFNGKDYGTLADVIGTHINISLEEKQEILEALDIPKRMELLYTFLERDVILSKLSQEITERVHATIEKHNKDYFLREQIKAISKELGEGEDLQAEAAEYRDKLSKLVADEETKEKISKEIDRLLKQQPMSPEAAVVRTYLDTVFSLPWGKVNEEIYDLQHATKVLDAGHYGLKKVKERILEYLAVRQLNNSLKGPILCLVGPPGVGKTSLGKSIAQAMGRKLTRISLGGVHDESEIRGHRRTYLGSLPGRLIKGMIDAKCLNPVLLMDEIDKLGADHRGDPASALLEALDPEQNNTFTDRFIDLPFDLSKVFWIVTANTLDTIPRPLLDRMEVIQLSSYTELEKLHIAKEHLLAKQRKENGLDKHRIIITEKALSRVIRDYTREAGVRELERKLGAIYRKLAFNIVNNGAKGAQINEKNLEKYLGPVTYLEDPVSLEPCVGSVNGLAWTSVGGELLRAEVLTVKGKGGLTLTGLLGDVMKESAQAGLTYIRSRSEELKLPEDFHEKLDIHIHLPEGAVPKDGPSAGVTMVTAMVSALTGRRVKGKLAMTGEIAFSGRVLAVGGIKEKVLAAYRHGVETVLLPESNRRDIDELPEEVRSAIKFIPVGHLDQVLAEALEA